jgi:hypothetical protein
MSSLLFSYEEGWDGCGGHRQGEMKDGNIEQLQILYHF